LLQWLGPLFVILFGFGALSREREQGTLTLLLSQGVRPWQLAAGKMLAHAAAVAVLLLPLGVMGVAAVVHPAFAPDAPVRVALLLAAFAAYLLSFSAITIGASSRVRSSGLALTVLLAVWLIVCVLAPRVTVLVAEARHPLPSSIQFLADYQAARGNQYTYGFSGYDTFNDVFERVQQRLFEEYGVTSAVDLPVNTFGYAIEETEQEGQRAYDETYGRLQRIVDRQDTVHRIAHFVSPAMAAQALTMGLAGTGHDEHLHFIDTAERYRRRMMHALNMDLAHNTHDPEYDVRLRNTGDYTRGVDLWGAIADFHYTPLTIPDVLAVRRTEVAALAVWLLAAGAFMGTGVRGACRRP
jgi:ABC-2 type transport system permease protein